MSLAIWFQMGLIWVQPVCKDKQTTLARLKFNIIFHHFKDIVALIMRGSRGGDRGSAPPPPPPIEKSQKLRVSSNTGPDPLEVTKLPSQYSMSGYHRPASKTPFKWRYTGGPMLAHSWWYLDPLFFPHQLKKTQSKLDPL